MKKLYVNGCSFVWGDELENREKEAFPFLLEKKLNCELINEKRNINISSIINRVFST